ncbi:MAG: N-acetylmuramic acid 6-phosphate etherase [Flavobacteriales bacterium]
MERGKKRTERPSSYQNLEEMPVQELLEGMNQEDRKVPNAVGSVLPDISALIEAIIPRMRDQDGRLFYIGAGTSGRLGILDASECPPTFGVPHDMVIGIMAGGDRALRKAVEFAEDDEEQAWKDLQEWGIDTHDTLIGLAASGTTPYVRGALERASEEGILNGAITCDPGSAVGKASEHPIEMDVGPEFLTGSTRLKAGTAQKMVLNMISTAVMVRLQKVKGNRMVDMQLSNEKLLDRGTRMLVQELGKSYQEARELLLREGSVRKALEKGKEEGKK